MDGGGDAVVDAVEATEAEEQRHADVREADEFRLSHAFYDAYKATRKLVNSEGEEQPSQSDIDDLAGKLKVIALRVAQLRLFSPNEELDDVATADLKFLLVPSLLADVVAAARDLNERPKALRQALVFWRAFAADCQRLGIAHRDDLRAIDRSPEEAPDAATKRDEKIARYKRSKELDAKVAYLFGKKREALGDEYQWGHGAGFDEDQERELILTLLGRAVAAAVESIASAEQELPLLEMMLARGGPGAPPPPKPPPSEKPFVVRIQDKAELNRMYQEMVFQCPYSLPTMTLAECADAEMADMRERQERQAAAERSRQTDEDQRWWGGDRQGAQEDDEDERQLYKDRDFDEFKDEHPWGSGNKMANVS